NNALIVPTYNDPNDALILETLKQHTPLEVIGVDCNTLIKQHGSLHCVTMQLY
ncbi:agmatine deiminase family protein, partial [Helicobacter pylori]